MERQALQELLAELPFARGLSPPALAALATQAKKIDLAAGRIVFREGEQSDRFFLIVAGRIALEMCVPARGCAHLLTLGAGDLLAWSALLGGDRMTASAIVLEDAELIEFSGRGLLRLCDSDHDLGYLLMRRLAESLSKRLIATRLQLLDLFELQTPLAPQG